MTRLPRGARRFLQYGLIGGGTFAADLLMLGLLTEYLALPYLVSTPASFLVAVSANYLLSRRFVFAYSARSMRTGYIWFILIAISGALFITAGVGLLVTKANLPYLLARIAVSPAAGVGNYLANLYLNFRVAGVHREWTSDGDRCS